MGSSYGRLPDAYDTQQFFSNPTLGKPNIIAGVSDKENVISNFQYYKNYPNPIKPTTRIKYFILVGT